MVFGVAGNDRTSMAKYLGLVAAAGAIGLSLARLQRLLDGDPRLLIVFAASAVLGATLAAVRPRTILLPIGAAAVFLNLAVPDTLRWGLIPSIETWPAAGEELSLAFELIRFGSAPVLATAGLVGTLAVIYWTLGAAAMMWRRLPLAASAPALAFYLILATLDRRPPGTSWILGAAAVAGLLVLSQAIGSDNRSGRIQVSDGRFVPRRSASTGSVVAVSAVALAVFVSGAAAASVPESGVLSWRSRSGLGIYGGNSYNLFVGLQQDLLDLSDEPVFYARLNESAPPNLYWRLVTLDSYDGEFWTLGEQGYEKLGEDRWEDEDMSFRGPTAPVSAVVRIASLAQPLLPVLYSPTGLRSDVDLISNTFRVREDGAVAIDLRTNPGWEYEITAEVPRPDLAALATTGSELSPIFARAAEAGAFTGDPRPTRRDDPSETLERYLDLPSGISPTLRSLAREVTTQGSTHFEEALLLESWFRDSFTYSVDVSTGHTSLDLVRWLADPFSPNYRTGYCEQFATAFAVMARTLGIPARVVLGFTPGETTTQEDGSEIVVVRDRNAHAWVDLWMDGQGWVPFDPTPRSDGVNPAFNAAVGFDLSSYITQPDEPAAGAPDRQSTSREDVEPILDEGIIDLEDIPAQGQEGFRIPAVLGWALLIAAAVMLVPAYKSIRRRVRIARIRNGDITAAWEEIVDQLQDIGREPSPHLTPIEAARAVHPGLAELANLYSAAIYGGQRPDGTAAFARAESAVKGLRSQRLRSRLSPASLRSPIRRTQP